MLIGRTQALARMLFRNHKFIVCLQSTHILQKNIYLIKIRSYDFVALPGGSLIEICKYIDKSNPGQILQFL